MVGDLDGPRPDVGSVAGRGASSRARRYVRSFFVVAISRRCVGVSCRFAGTRDKIHFCLVVLTVGRGYAAGLAVSSEVEVL